jgi:hypothetical protein
VHTRATWQYHGQVNPALPDALPACLPACLQGRWGEAARKLADVLDDDTFRSLEGKSKHQLWLELCDIITKHPKEVGEG